MGVNKLDKKMREVMSIPTVSSGPAPTLTQEQLQEDRAGEFPSVQIHTGTCLLTDGYGLLCYASRYLIDILNSEFGGAYPVYEDLDRFIRHHIAFLRSHGVTLQVFFEDSASDREASTLSWQGRERAREWNQKFRMSHMYANRN